MLFGTQTAKFNDRQYFQLYGINSIQDLDLSPGTRLVLYYADDILLYKPIHCLRDYQQYQSDINIVSMWLKREHLSINPAKCKYMVVTHKRFSILQTPPPPPILIESIPTEKVSEMQYLGVLLTSDLSWSNHIHKSPVKPGNLQDFYIEDFTRT